jgi:ribosome-associated translation inhibitor RaiA
MQIRTNTGGSLDGSAALAARAEAIVEGALGRFSDRITTVQVHLGDENSVKGGAADKRCTMEARLEGLQPIAVTHDAGDLELAMRGAADKLERSIESTLGRLRGR